MVENVSLEKHKAKNDSKPYSPPTSETEVTHLNSFLPFLGAASCPFKSFLLEKTIRRPQRSGSQNGFSLTDNQANYFTYIYICFLIPLFPLLKKKKPSLSTARIKKQNI